MKKKNTRSIAFFNASLLLEDLSENEMFRLKGGTSDTGEYDELEEVEVVGQIPNDEEEEEEEDGFDPEDGYDWDDADNDPTDDEGWNDENGSDGSEVDTETPDSSDPSDGPWLRDADGNLLMTPTGRTLSKYGIGPNKFDFTEVKIKTASGQEITAYQVTAVYDADGNPLPMEERFKSNCTGYAVAGGDVWITDLDEADDTNYIDQAMEFQNMLSDNALFQEVSKEEADIVVASYHGDIMHSGEYDPATDTYTWKNSQSEIKTGTYEEFSGTYDDDHTVKYYKRNY